MSNVRQEPAHLVTSKRKPAFKFGFSRGDFNVIAYLLVALFLAWWTRRLLIRLHERADFDDAYMFYRYAMNIRSGLGVSWNLDGVPTYGQTAPLWSAAVLLLSYLPLTMSKALILGSWFCSIGAAFTMAWAVAVNARSVVMSKVVYVFPLIAFPLGKTSIFFANAVTGMETMLALMLTGVYVGLALGWQRGRVRPELAGLAGLLLFLVRPEAAMIVVLCALAVFSLLPGTQVRGLVTLLGVFLAGVLLELVICKMYFHTALPLSFYMKSRHAYEGYRRSWEPITAAYGAVSACVLYIGCLALFGRRSDWRLVLSLLGPAFVVFAYLCSVTQIMGLYSRYYLPYIPLLVVPALLVLDKRISELASGDTRRLVPFAVFKHVAVAVLVMLCFLGTWPVTIAKAADRRLGQRLFAYDPVRLDFRANVSLPQTQYNVTLQELTRRLLVPLPHGATIAASEVGYIGALAPQVNVIDLAGLNDTDIAVNGFKMASLLARKPDIIWMPHEDYTYQRGKMLADPALLSEYELYAGAANYGIALRKDSPIHAEMKMRMQEFWKNLYPGYRMDDYLVRSASWTEHKHEVTGLD